MYQAAPGTGQKNRPFDRMSFRLDLRCMALFQETLELDFDEGTDRNGNQHAEEAAQGAAGNNAGDDEERMNLNLVA